MKTVILPSIKISPQVSNWLDLIRGLAAIAVMVGHIKALFFVQYAQVKSPNILTKLFYLLTGLGYQAVIVFFVLSGFFISSSIFKMLSQNRWSWREYLLQRLARLWVVLLPALVLTAAWDIGGIHLFGPAVYSGLPSDHAILSSSVFDHLTLAAFAGNVLFLQGIMTKTFGSNGPLWSLSFEFWYYIAFPCAVLALSSRSLKTKLAYTVALVLLGLFVGKIIALFFAVWLLGVAVIFLPGLWDNHKPVPPYAVWLSLVPFGASLLLSVAKKDQFPVVLVAIPFTLLIYLLFRLPHGDPASGPSPFLTKFSKGLAGFSYSLYLLHLPPIIFVHALLHRISPEKWQPTPANLLLATLIGACVTLYAFAISMLTEAKTPQFRAFLRRFMKAQAA